MIRYGLILGLTLGLFFALTAKVQSGPEDEAAAAGDPTAGASYVGEAKCKKCHFKQHRTWKKNVKYPHFKAWDTLKPHFKGADQKDDNGHLCISCHVTGFGEADRGGFKDVESSAHLLGVQCEACHGPGSNHVKSGEKLKAEKRKKYKPGEKTNINRNVTSCASCHNPHHPHAKMDK